MNSHIPNSEDLFTIYKENLKAIKDINKIVVSNRMDKKYFSNLKDTIKYSMDALNNLVNAMNDVSVNVQGMVLGSKSIEAFGSMVDTYLGVMSKLSKVPVKSLIANRRQMRMIKKQIKSLLEFASSIGDATSAVKIKLAQISLKNLEPIMESLMIITAPLNQLTIKDMMRYSQVIRRYKRLFRRIKRLINNLADIKLIKTAKASKNTEFISKVFDSIHMILVNLEDKITYKDLRKYRKYIKQLHKILFGGTFWDKLFGSNKTSVLSLIESLGDIPIHTVVRAMANATMIQKSFLAIVNILHMIADEMDGFLIGFFEKINKKLNLKRISDLIVGEKNSVVALMDDVASDISRMDALNATISMMAAVLFIKAINILLHSLPKVSRRTKKGYRKRIGLLYKIIIGENEKDQQSLLFLMNSVSENKDVFKEGMKVLIDIIKGIAEIVMTVPSFKDIIKAEINLLVIRVFLATYYWLCKYIIKKSTEMGEDKEKLSAAINDIKNLMLAFSEISKATPKFEEMLRMILIIPVFALIVTEYIFFLDLIGIFTKGAGKEKKEKALAVIKDIGEVIKEFALTVKLCPPPKQLAQALPVIAIMMLIITGFMLTINLIIKSEQAQGKRSKRAMRNLKFTIRGMLVLVIGMLLVGAAVLIGTVVIAAAVAFVGLMVALSLVLGLALPLIKKGAIAILLMELLVLGMALCILPLVIIAQNTEWKDLVGVLLTTLLFVAVVGGLIEGLGYILTKYPQAYDWIITGIVIFAVLEGLIWLLGKCMEPFARIGEILGDTPGKELLGITQATTLFVLEMAALMTALGAIAIGSFGIGAGAMAAGAGLLASIAGTMWVVGDAIEAIVNAWKVLKESGLAGENGETAMENLRAIMLMPLGALIGAPGPDGKWLMPSLKDKGALKGSVVDLLDTLDKRQVNQVKKKVKRLSNIILSIADIGTSLRKLSDAAVGVNVDPKEGVKGMSGILIATNKVLEFATNDNLDKISGKQVRKTKKILKLIRTIGKMARLLKKLSSMKIPEYDESGKITGYVNMGKKEFQAASDNVKLIMTTFIRMFEDRGENGKGETNNEILNKTRKSSIRKLKKILQLAKPVSTMLDVIEKMSKMVIPDTIDKKTGKPLTWKKLDKTAMDQAATNVGMIVSTFIRTVDFGSNQNTTLTGIIADITAGQAIRRQRVKLINEVIEPTSKLIDIIQKIHNLKMPEVNPDGTIKTKADGSIAAWKSISIDQIKSSGQEVAEIIKKFIDNIDLGAPKNGFAATWDLITGRNKARKNRIEQLKTVIDPISKILDIVTNFYSSKIPTGINAKGEVTGWKLLKSADINGSKIFAIIRSFIQGTINVVKGIKLKDLQSSKQIMTEATEAMKIVSESGSYIELCSKYQDIKMVKSADFGINTPVALAIARFANLMSLIDWKEIKVNSVKGLAEAAVGFEPYIMLAKRSEDMVLAQDEDGELNIAPGIAIKKLLNLIKKGPNDTQVKNFKQATDDSIRLVRSINSLDISRADSLAEVFKRLWQFSVSINGNFDKLADVINEKLIAAIEKLESVMDEVANKEFKVEVDYTSQQPSAAGALTPGSSNGQNNNQAISNLQTSMNSLKSTLDEIKECIGTESRKKFLRVKTHREDWN